MINFDELFDNADHMLEATICGSMKQRSLFEFAERLLVERFKDKGIIVNQPVLYFENDYARNLVSASVKAHLHEEKIMRSDFILVVDGLFPGTAYYGVDTTAEILKAEEYGIPVFKLSDILNVSFIEKDS